jgi:hypothetical protein
VTLANPNAQGTLTLGKVAVSGLKATATASYSDSNNQNRQVVLVAEVVGEVQLVFGDQSNDNCPYIPDLGTVLKRSHKAHLERSYSILESADNQANVQQAITDARTILQAAHTRLAAIVDDNNDIG